MEKRWVCESCGSQDSQNGVLNGPILETFSSPECLIQHIIHRHLSKKLQHGRSVFVCTYGPLGVCSKVDALNSHLRNPPTFESEYEYEHHLVTKHIIGITQSGSSSTIKRPDIYSQSAHAWTQHDSVVNMAAILNDPTDRQLDIFSRYWGDGFEHPTFPPLRLPVISEDQFLPYLTLLTRRKLLTPSPPAADSSPPLPDAVDLKAADAYCSPNFKLSDPETFNSVIPLHQRRLCTTLHEVFAKRSDQLSQLLDAVELAIVNHVSERSASLFEAVRANDVVKDQLSQIVSQINTIRSRLKRVDAIYCRGAAQIITLARRQRNLKALLAKLEVVASVHAAQPTIQSLLKSNDFCSALDLIDSTRESLSAINNPPDNGDKNLARRGEIVCLRHLDAQLTEIAKFINTMVVTEFEAALHSVLASPPNESIDPNALGVLLPTAQGLIRIEEKGFVATIDKEIKNVLKDTFERLCGSLLSGENGNGQEVIRNSIGHPAEQESLNIWLNKMKNVCLTVEKVLLRVRTVVELISSKMTEQGERLRHTYWKVVDHSQHRIASFINALLSQSRTQNRTIATSEDFIAFAEVIENYHERVIVSAWHIYRPDLPLTSQSMTLRNLVASRATLLVKTFHKDHCKILKQSLDQETWRPAEKSLSPPLLDLLNHLLSHHELKTTPNSEAISASTDTKLVIEDEIYVVIDTVITLIPLLLDYLRLGEQLAIWPLLLRDIQVNLSEFLLIFNSQSYVLVLGAEAYQRNALKKISARNMALLARSLESVLALIPVVQIFFERIHFKSTQGRITTPGVRKEAETPLTDPFQNTAEAIRSHISEVMDELTALLARRIAKIMQSWQPRPPTPSAEMQSVCQSISKLTKSTADILSSEMLTNLLLRIHTELKATFRQRLTHLSLFPDGGPKQSLVNLELMSYMRFLCVLTPALSQFTDECDDVWPSGTAPSD